jgi:hypothetical protein
MAQWLPVLLLAASCAGSGKQVATSAKPADLDEPSLMTRLHDQLQPDPASALALAEEGERRFADSPRAEERSALAIQALINLDRIGAARSRAYKFLARYPDGAYSAHVAAMTGVHPTPAGPGAHN